MNERELRRIQQFRDDQATLRDAAQRVRRSGDEGELAGLDDPVTAGHLAAILDYFAEHLGTLTPDLREHASRVAAELVGDRMDRPSVRRTRRR